MAILTRRSVLQTSVALAATSAARPTLAQTATYTAADLNGKLTPLGAERAGNADGSIPAWTGGYTDQSVAVPFADEKPALTVTAANAATYQDKLAYGTLALLQRYPDYRLDVYPTHRTAVAPQYVYDNTFKNATRAAMAADGNSISGAYGGTPFPIPANGHEVMWNHLLAWKGTTLHNASVAYTATSAGTLQLASRTDAFDTFPYYYPDGEKDFDGYYMKIISRILAPPYQAGGGALQMQPLNPIQQPPRGWQYLAGQRRTREAPQLEYDTPNFFADGIGNFDEYQVFWGALDEYDCKLVGKKEMYVPYNMNKALSASAQEQLKGHFFSPDYSRWELHRVWIVEMTVKAGKRNVDAKRIMYVDEDTWNILLCDIYDSSNTLWKFIFSVPLIMPKIPCLLGSTFTLLHDLHANVYATFNGLDSSIHNPWEPIPQKPASFFTPGQLAALAGGM